ncbi:MAG: DUF86 domain-containing protein [Coriobacteriales bacterium]|jgi:uncharacterized protein with HEPN domain|nr:DUF86 domain-containing protein [Coriobacteriales bacterium]
MLNAPKQDSVYLEDALEYVQLELQEVDNGLTLARLLENRNAQDLATHRIIMTGESLNHVSDRFQKSHPEIAWSDIIGMRNVLLHDYAKVNYELVWRTLNEDFPGLAVTLLSLIESSDE